MRKRESLFAEELFKLLLISPWWTGPALAVSSFCAFRFLVPLLFESGRNKLLMPMTGFWGLMSWVVGGLVAAGWIAAEITRWRNRQLFERSADIAAIRALSWEQFESLVTEALRRRGFVAERVGSSSADGGIDIILYRGGAKTLVQCKHWKVWKVAVGPVRELLGVVCSEAAQGGMLVTSGRFTAEALRFAQKNPQLFLMDGNELARMIGEVRDRPLEPKEEGGQAVDGAPTCPLCGGQMALKTARQGKNRGSVFWGCKRFPVCRGTREHSAESLTMDNVTKNR